MHIRVLIPIQIADKLFPWGTAATLSKVRPKRREHGVSRRTLLLLAETGSQRGQVADPQHAWNGI